MRTAALCFAVMAAALAGCNNGRDREVIGPRGEQGERGETGLAGAPGLNGLTSLVASAPEAEGANCPAGGHRLTFGLDINQNGALDTAEVQATRYVCSGVPGADGPQGTPGANGVSVLTSAEAAGPNCARGGVKLVSAAGTHFVCNGEQGDAGASGQSVTSSAELPGPNCPAGGVKLVSASGTAYVCNGAQGSNGQNGANGTSVTATAEPTGMNCPNGGVKLTSASGSHFVCNGASGAQGSPGQNGASAAFKAGRFQNAQFDFSGSPQPKTLHSLAFSAPTSGYLWAMATGYCLGPGTYISNGPAYAKLGLKLASTSSTPADESSAYLWLKPQETSASPPSGYVSWAAQGVFPVAAGADGVNLIATEGMWYWTCTGMVTAHFSPSLLP